MTSTTGPRTPPTTIQRLVSRCRLDRALARCDGNRLAAPSVCVARWVEVEVAALVVGGAVVVAWCHPGCLPAYAGALLVADECARAQQNHSRRQKLSLVTWMLRCQCLVVVGENAYSYCPCKLAQLAGASAIVHVHPIAQVPLLTNYLIESRSGRPGPKQCM